MCLYKNPQVTTSVQSTDLIFTFWKMLVRTGKGLCSPWIPIIVDEKGHIHNVYWGEGTFRAHHHAPLYSWISKNDVKLFVEFCQSKPAYHDPILGGEKEAILCAIPVQVLARDIVDIGPHDSSVYSNQGFVASIAVEVLALSIDKDTIKKALAGSYDIAIISYTNTTVCRAV